MGGACIRTTAHDSRKGVTHKPCQRDLKSRGQVDQLYGGQLALALLCPAQGCTFNTNPVCQVLLRNAEVTACLSDPFAE